MQVCSIFCHLILKSPKRQLIKLQNVSLSVYSMLVWLFDTNFSAIYSPVLNINTWYCCVHCRSCCRVCSKRMTSPKMLWKRPNSQTGDLGAQASMDFLVGTNLKTSTSPTTGNNQTSSTLRGTGVLLIATIKYFVWPVIKKQCKSLLEAEQFLAVFAFSRPPVYFAVSFFSCFKSRIIFCQR